MKRTAFGQQCEYGSDVGIPGADRIDNMPGRDRGNPKDGSLFFFAVGASFSQGNDDGIPGAGMKVFCCFLIRRAAAQLQSLLFIEMKKGAEL